jgi:hypothetical protein
MSRGRNYIIIALDKLGLSVAQGTLSSLNSSAKISEASSILLSLLASFLASLEFLFQTIGAFFGATQGLWKDKMHEDPKQERNVLKLQMQ